VRALAIVTVIGSTALAIATSALAWLNRDTQVPESLYIGSKVDVGSPIFTLVFVATGALIALRQPRHPVGWCFILLGLFGDLFLAFANYGLYGTLTTPGGLPAAEVAVWISHWFWAIPSSVLPLMLLLFPNGRPPTARWWPVAWLAVGATLLFAVTDAFGASPAADTLDGPLGTSISLALGWASLVGTLLWALTLIAAVASLVVRFRRSHGVERQQLKWFVSAAAVVVSLQLPGLLVPVASVPPVIGVLSNLSFGLLPVSAAIAILRYRLYDIDLIINRTVVYVLLTAVLAGVYTGAVALFQRLFVALSGQGSDLAIVMTLFVLATVFTPIKNTLQENVDRRIKPARPGARTDNRGGGVDDLVMLAELHRNGVLTDEEFAAKKRQVLGI